MDKSELIELIEGPIFEIFKKAKLESKGTNDTTTTTTTTTTTDTHTHISEAQRDRRTVFVQQLSVRCTDRDLFNFFTENDCPVRHSRIVLDKYTRKSKGVAYVEFYEEETVRKGLKLSGKKLLGVPVIVELTETEKNRIAQEAALMNSTTKSTGIPSAPSTSTSNKSAADTDNLLRLYVGSLHPSLSESDLKQLFEPFGELESVELSKEGKGVAFIQYKKIGSARAALTALNGFVLAGKAIRVGPVVTAGGIANKSSNKQSRTEFKSEEPLEHDEHDEHDEHEEIKFDSKKRTELMQKLSRK